MRMTDITKADAQPRLAWGSGRLGNIQAPGVRHREGKSKVEATAVSSNVTKINRTGMLFNDGFANSQSETQAGSATHLLDVRLREKREWDQRSHGASPCCATEEAVRYAQMLAKHAQSSYPSRISKSATSSAVIGRASK